MDLGNDDQQPVGSPFGATSTAAEVLAGVDLAGRLAVVTGGYSGIGLATVAALAEAGAEVLVPARRPAEAREALAGVPGASRVTVAAMDLADQASVAAWADGVLAAGRPVDVVIGNAGVMATPETRVGPGWELQLATNHLGHFALVARLWPLLVAARDARVVSVSSLGHHHSPIRWDDPGFERGYDKWQAYGQSKTANILFARHLARVGAPYGVRAYSLHPGAILTSLGKHMTEQDLDEVLVRDASGNLALPEFKTPAQGAATSVFAATSPLLADRSGCYLEDCDVAGYADAEGLRDTGVKRYAVDPDEAARLWDWSATATGVAPG
ncbi:oxidoreductase [Nocardioides sp. SYSU DS0651]|uniref:oxidoreductase n=1 Tax=Nocardioides sp. SYSU DS0651 TaxID=3415955 RepID=UPI003F4B17D1